MTNNTQDQNRNETTDRYDAVIIGGGAAGLNAAVALGRARRRVAVVDAGEPRNAAAAGVHNFLTRDGIAPAELVRIGRMEAESYGGVVFEGTAASASRDDDGFTVTLDDGTRIRGRRLLIASGLIDELPDVVGLRDRWGVDVLHCPYCHGWEVRDQAIGILATGPMAVHQALLFRQLSSRITVFLHTAPALSDELAEQLAARGIAVIEGNVESVSTTDYALSAVVLTDGSVHPIQAMVVAPTFTARTAVVESLGLDVSTDPRGIGTFVESDATGLTRMPGVWVAGNVTDLTAQVITAAAAGLMAGAAINADLIAEELEVAVQAYRAAQRLPHSRQAG
ncbi:NAD(P)/FAD-dependent oxidoreductase [Leifsonia kafniensis]|uniref:NAD(P)/FAD-dependent oxidoreductase n=1 Tax=Leifsonia kafniensis TaxID=475957 RepID=A0ABP7KCE5_9MICO